MTAQIKLTRKDVLHLLSSNVETDYVLLGEAEQDSVLTMASAGELWYPDNSGHWIEATPENVDYLLKNFPDEKVYVLLAKERWTRNYFSGFGWLRSANEYNWVTLDDSESRIVAFKYADAKPVETVSNSSTRPRFPDQRPQWQGNVWKTKEELKAYLNKFDAVELLTEDEANGSRDYDRYIFPIDQAMAYIGLPMEDVVAYITYKYA